MCERGLEEFVVLKRKEEPNYLVLQIRKIIVTEWTKA